MKKIISVFLIISFLVLITPLTAKERRGAELVVQKRDGKQIRGELIAVKENSLLLLSPEGADVSVDIGEISVIKIVKKSNFLKSAGIGLIGGAGALMGLASYQEPKPGEWVFFSQRDSVLMGGLAFGLIGLLIGGISGAFASIDEVIHMEGKSSVRIRRVLRKLHTKARVPNYN